jgi:hypothetical protein
MFLPNFISEFSYFYKLIDSKILFMNDYFDFKPGIIGKVYSFNLVMSKLVIMAIIILAVCFVQLKKLKLHLNRKKNAMFQKRDCFVQPLYEYIRVFIYNIYISLVVYIWNVKKDCYMKKIAKLLIHDRERWRRRKYRYNTHKYLFLVSIIAKNIIIICTEQKKVYRELEGKILYNTLSFFFLFKFIIQKQKANSKLFLSLSVRMCIYIYSISCVCVFVCWFSSLFFSISFCFLFISRFFYKFINTSLKLKIHLERETEWTSERVKKWVLL